VEFLRNTADPPKEKGKEKGEESRGSQVFMADPTLIFWRASGEAEPLQE
jgi:hypothetical protein